MKGSVSIPVKRGWRGLVILVLALVFLSMTVPLSFIFGPHNNRSQFGYGTEGRRIASDNRLRIFDPPDGTDSVNQSEDDSSKHVDDLIKRFGPQLPKDVIDRLSTEADNKNKGTGFMNVAAEENHFFVSKGSILEANMKLPPSGNMDKSADVAGIDGSGLSHDETPKTCQLEFGSYCLWCEEHKEDMKDSMVKKLKDQLFIARAYFPSIAKLPKQDKLSRDMKSNIQEFERMLSDATTDANLPHNVEVKRKKMKAVIAQAKFLPVDCNNVVKKFAQLVDLTQDEAHFHMKQSAFLYQLAVQTMPKSHHCLSMRLTVEFFRSHPDKVDLFHEDKQDFPFFYHYIIFSRNILAASVVINSTIVHSEETEKLVFHLITDGENFVAMKHWFLRNFFENATIHVLNIEELNLKDVGDSDIAHIPFSDEFRVSVRSTEQMSATHMRTEYLSVFSPAHFFLPEIFQNLERVIVLGDDVVVQRDLSPLWSLDMQGKVNGAVEFCDVRLGQMKSYLRGENVNDNACAWMSGLNVIDLKRWRELKVTETYRRLLQGQLIPKKVSLRGGALPVVLLTFQDLIYPLDDSWAISGLGQNYSVDQQALGKAAVLHYNGKMKPWLELGIPAYKGLWKKYLQKDDQYMEDCNVNP